MGVNDTKKKNKLIYIVLAILVFICAIVIAFVNSRDNTDEKEIVTVTLKGTNNISLTLNTSYTDMGFTVLVNDKEVSGDDIHYRITNNIENGIVGEYNVHYEIMYNNKTYELNRKVNIIDETPPEILLDTQVIEIFECKKKNTTNLIYEAIDNYDGVITNKVVKDETDTSIKLSVTDSSGNETVVEVPKKKVSDPSKVIKLNGKSLIYIAKGDKYTDEGAKVYNGCGKELKDKLEVINKVNVNEAGTYNVVYNIKDGNNNIVTKTRKVIVYDKKEADKKENNKSEKVIYLTFDDGPGRYTSDLLKILKKYDVKATFFVTNQFKDYVPLIKDIDKAGHKVAVHTLTHKWSIYSSVETYMKDFNDMNNIIYNYTGKKSKIFRFPGGSSNTVSKGYSKGVVSAIASKMNNMGYVYFDWNVDSEDAAGASRNAIVKNTIEGIDRKDYPVVLMHDIKKNTLDAIEEIIVYCKNKGYKFDVLTENSPSVRHGIRN